MTYEARVTIHQKGTQKPDYNDIHIRMKRASYDRVLTAGGHRLNELHGMYRKSFSANSIEVEERAIEGALRVTGFTFSIELFKVAETRTFNLEEAPNYSAMLAGLLSL